ncbi:hypothetical protein PsorP6_015994 [Peronosclerospora sorghi]|uniref:Uncharacterized protein n=1 Tax=Peronosclerospora sorghi TaxID=230839 RepID=A0ACC0WMS6_9STRA|nr:hypothetical protein PsorP6_015994 [Peronosclerospora sorghi]
MNFRAGDIAFDYFGRDDSSFTSFRLGVMPRFTTNVPKAWPKTAFKCVLKSELDKQTTGSTEVSRLRGRASLSFATLSDEDVWAKSLRHWLRGPRAADRAGLGP